MDEEEALVHCEELEHSCTKHGSDDNKLSEPPVMVGSGNGSVATDTRPIMEHSDECPSQKCGIEYGLLKYWAAETNNDDGDEDNPLTVLTNEFVEALLGIEPPFGSSEKATVEQLVLSFGDSWDIDALNDDTRKIRPQKVATQKLRTRRNVTKENDTTTFSNATADWQREKRQSTAIVIDVISVTQQQEETDQENAAPLFVSAVKFTNPQSVDTWLGLGRKSQLKMESGRGRQSAFATEGSEANWRRRSNAGYVTFLAFIEAYIDDG